VDRVFTIKGAGTVVTGTLWSGSIGRGDELTVLPRGRRARVRGVQVHDSTVDRAGAGQRVAVNLVLGRDEIARGDVLAGGEGGPLATYRVDARLDCAPETPRVAVHHGTRETPARAVHVAGDEWQLRLDHQLVAAPGDRVVIRTIAPPDTLGGGVILDAAPPRTRHPAQQPCSVQLHEAGQSKIVETVPVAAEARLRAAGYEPPLDVEFDGADLAALRELGRAVRLGPAMHVHVEALAEVEGRLRALLEAEGRVTLARFRDELQTSRKYAQALLEHFDSERVTLRVGEERVLRARRTRREPE
jgi:selenocysteine-specific elongation factor